MSFENKIQQWVSIDNQLKILNEKMKLLRESKNELSEDITNYASKNNLSNSTIQISDGKIKFANTRVAEPLTFKYLERSLAEIIKKLGNCFCTSFLTGKIIQSCNRRNSIFHHH